MRKNQNLTIILMFIAAIFILWTVYIPLLDNYFYLDDTQWIWFSAVTPLHRIFFDGDSYRYLSGCFFTPMVGLSFKIDWILSGMNPRGYFIHSFLVFFLTTIMLYKFLRLYVHKIPSAMVCLLFSISPLTVNITSWFSTRHYMEGIFWALLSLFLLIRAQRTGKPFSILSGAAYLFASLNKEVYVVLPAIAFLLAEGGLSRRLRTTAPHWLLLALYMLWRFYMLQGFGGYPDNVVSFGVLENIINPITALPFYSFGKYWPLIMAPVAILVIANLNKRQIGVYSKYLFIFFILLLPVAFLNFFAYRVFFHLSLFIIILSTVLGYITFESRKYLRIPLIVFFMIVVSVFYYEDREIVNKVIKEREISKASAEAYISGSKKYPWPQELYFYEGLKSIYRDFYGKEINTKLVPSMELIRYAEINKLKELKQYGIDIDVDAIILKQGSLRDGPILVDFKWAGYKIEWKLKSPKEGSFIVLDGPEKGLYYYSTSLKNEGSYSRGLTGKDKKESLYLRILFRSKDGEEIISPEFKIEIPGEGRYLYNRLISFDK